MVSRSRISPIMMQSGAWRSAFFRATCMLAVSRPTSRWLTIERLLLNRNSIGSSMVRMWPETFWLRHSSMAAMVVLLPVPVAPTIRIRPRFSSTSGARMGGRFRVSIEGILTGTQRTTAAMLLRCLKPERRKLPTLGMPMPMLSSPVWSSSSSCSAVSTSASRVRGMLGASTWSVMGISCPLIFSSAGALADR